MNIWWNITDAIKKVAWWDWQKKDTSSTNNVDPKKEEIPKQQIWINIWDLPAQSDYFNNIKKRNNLEKQYEWLLKKRNYYLSKAINVWNVSTPDLDKAISWFNTLLVKSLLNNPDPIQISEQVKQSYAVALDKIKEDKVKTFNEVKSNYLDITNKYKDITWEDPNALQDMTLLNQAATQLYQWVSTLEKYKSSILTEIDKRTKDILARNKDMINRYASLVSIYRKEKQDVLNTAHNKASILKQYSSYYSWQMWLLERQLKDVTKQINNEAKNVILYNSVKWNIEDTLWLTSQSISSWHLKLASDRIDEQIKRVNELRKNNTLSLQDMKVINWLYNNLIDRKYQINQLNENINTEVSNWQKVHWNTPIQDSNTLKEMANKIVSWMNIKDWWIINESQVEHIIQNKLWKDYVSTTDIIDWSQLDSSDAIRDLDKKVIDKSSLTNYKDFNFQSNLDNKLSVYTKNATPDEIKKNIIDKWISEPLKKRVVLSSLFNNNDVSEWNYLVKDNLKSLYNKILLDTVKWWMTNDALNKAIRHYSEDFNDLADNAVWDKDNNFYWIKLTWKDIEDYIKFKINKNVKDNEDLYKTQEWINKIKEWLRSKYENEAMKMSTSLSNSLNWFDF